jgi:ABC-type phosphate transport system substrate-binding protein
MRLSADELMFLIQASENATIRGKDASAVAPILTKLKKEFEKKVEKENGDLEKVTDSG